MNGSKDEAVPTEKMKSARQNNIVLLAEEPLALTLSEAIKTASSTTAASPSSSAPPPAPQQPTETSTNNATEVVSSTSSSSSITAANVMTSDSNADNTSISKETPSTSATSIPPPSSKPSSISQQQTSSSSSTTTSLEAVDEGVNTSLEAGREGDDTSTTTQSGSCIGSGGGDEEEEILPYAITISGEPPKSERVENLIKLGITLTPQKPGVLPISSKWNSIYISAGVFSSPKGITIQRKPMLNSSLSSDDSSTQVKTEEPGTETAVSAKGEETDETTASHAMPRDSFLIAEVAVVKKDFSGNVQPVVPCNKCVEREVRKLSAVVCTSSMRAVAAASVAERVSSELTQKLRKACSRTMLVFHCTPTVPINGFGVPNAVLKFRVICYSSHQKEDFFVMIRLWDPVTGNCVGEAISKRIVILDNHKSKRKSVVALQSSSSSSSSHAAGTVRLSSKEHGTRSKRRRSEPSSRDGQAMEGFVVPPPPPLTLGPNMIPTDVILEPFTAFSQQLLSQDLHASTNDGITFYQVIPSSGSVTGGVQITVLGKGFHPGHQLLFGPNMATDTKCWNDATLVCTLPPSSQKGVVPVSVFGAVCKNTPYFTYTDDTDTRFLLHTLNVIQSGARTNTEQQWNGSNPNPTETQAPTNEPENEVKREPSFPFQSRSMLMQYILHRDPTKDEEVVLYVLESLSSSTTTMNFFCLEENTGLTLMHFAAMKGYANLCKFLFTHAPALAVIGDRRGYTPLHFACLFSALSTVGFLLQQDSVNLQQRAVDGRTAIDCVTDPIVMQHIKQFIILKSCSSESSDDHKQLSGVLKIDTRIHSETNNSGTNEFLSEHSSSTMSSSSVIELQSPPDVPASMFTTHLEEEEEEVSQHDNLLQDYTNRKDEELMLNSDSNNPFTAVKSFPLSSQSTKPEKSHESEQPSGTFPSSLEHTEASSDDNLLEHDTNKQNEVIQINGTDPQRQNNWTVQSWLLSHAQQSMLLMIITILGIVIVSIASLKPGGYYHGEEPPPAQYNSSEMIRLISVGDENMMELRVLTILSSFVYGCFLTNSLVKAYHKHWVLNLIFVICSFIICLYHIIFALTF